MIVNHMEDEETKAVMQAVLARRDMKLADAAVRDTKRIPTHLLSVPDHLSGRQFMREILNRYAKYTDVEDDTKILWQTALACGAEKLVSRLLKETKDYQYLPEIAGGREEMFALLLHIRPGGILDEVKAEVLCGALRSGDWKGRFSILTEKGWKKSSVNRREEIRVADRFAGKLEQKNIPPTETAVWRR